MLNFRLSVFGSSLSHYEANMRAIIFMLIVSLVGGQKLKYEPGFSDGLMHIYKYEGIILSGLQENGLSRAGMKINCRLSVIPCGHATYLLKVMNFQIQEYSGVWPLEPFTSAYKLTQKLAPEITKPVKFKYSNGQVGNIFAPVNLPEDILNIHRGILNIFQITIKKSQNFYELQEAGIEGVCLTNYIIQENKKANRITVSKSKDLNNCQEKVMLFTGAAYASHCPVFKKEGRNIRAATNFIQVLKPTASGAILQEARVREMHQFTPFHEQDGVAVIEARQKLALVEVKAAIRSLPQVQFVERGTLRYRYSGDILQKPLQLTHLQNIKKATVETLKQLEAHSVPKVHSDTPAKFLQLIQLLRSASEKTIASLWNDNHSAQIRRWILFALPAVGTVDALQFLKTKIQRFEVTILDAAQTLALAMHQVTADLRTLLIVKQLLVMIQVQQSPVLRPLVFLGYGSMIYRYCADQPTCPSSVLTLLHSFLADSAAQSNEEDMTLALKAIGNAGQPGSVKHIVKFLPGSQAPAANVPLKVQVDAVMALRNILRKDPTKVQSVTLRVFMNKQNHPEVRMSACAVYLCTKPPLNAVLILASYLLKETSLQVASFTYSLLRSLSRSSLPSFKPLAAASKMALKLLEARYDQLGLQFSHGFHLDVFSYKLMTGASTKVVLMKDVGSLIPSVAAAKVSGYTLGGFADLLEVGLRMEGLQEAIMKNREKVQGIPDMKQIQRILSKIPNLKSVPEKVPLASAYLKVFNQEIAFVDFRKDYIHKVIELLSGVDVKHGTQQKIIDRFRKPMEMHRSAASVTSEVRRFVPTCLGLSTELSLLSAVVAKAALKVTASTPATFSTLSQLLRANIELKVQVNPSVALYSKAVLGINAPFVQAGLEFTARFHSTLPVDVSIKINAKEGNLQISSVPLQKENQIMILKSEVFAVSRSIENLMVGKVAPILPEIKEANIVNQKFKTSQERESDDGTCLGFASGGAECLDNAKRPSPKPWVHHSCIKMSHFSFEVCLNIKVENLLFVQHCPLYRLMGTHVVRVLTRPVHSESEIKRLVLEVQAGPETGIKVIRLLEKQGLPLEQANGRTLLMKESHTQVGGRRPLTGGTATSNPRQQSSSSQSSEELNQVGELGSTVLVVVAKAVRSDGNLQGYQLTSTVESASSRPRLHLRVVELDYGSSWKMCLDASSPRPHKVMVMYRWGRNCEKYKITFRASLGCLANHPALKIQAKWASIPKDYITGSRIIGSGIVYLLGFSSRFKDNPLHQITQLIVLTSPWTVDSIMELPRFTIYYQGFELPVPLHVPELTPIVRAQGFKSIAKIPHLLLTINQKECIVTNDRVVTFDSNKLNYHIPNDCFYILTKDCTPTPAFVLLMRRAESQQTKKRIKLFVSAINTVIEAYLPEDRVKLIVNSVETTLRDEQVVLSEIITIQKNGTGFTLQAPSISIQRLFFDGEKIQMVLDQMMGKTCGLCGLNNGEKKLIMPNHEMARDVEHLFESWLCPGTSCKDDCRVRREFVELGRIIDFEGQASRCYSVEPVQQCLAQCTPMETRSRQVNFHCIPSNRAVNASTVSSFHWRAAHISLPTDSHTDCTCQCAET